MAVTGAEPISAESLKAAMDAFAEAQAALRSTFWSGSALIPNLGQSGDPDLLVSSSNGISASVNGYKGPTMYTATVTFTVQSAGTYDLTVSKSFDSRHVVEAGGTFAKTFSNASVGSGYMTKSLFVERIA